MENFQNNKTWVILPPLLFECQCIIFWLVVGSKSFFLLPVIGSKSLYLLPVLESKSFFFPPVMGCQSVLAQQLFCFPKVRPIYILRWVEGRMIYILLTGRNKNDLDPMKGRKRANWHSQRKCGSTENSKFGTWGAVILYAKHFFTSIKNTSF